MDPFVSQRPRSTAPILSPLASGHPGTAGLNEPFPPTWPHRHPRPQRPKPLPLRAWPSPSHDAQCQGARPWPSATRPTPGPSRRHQPRQCRITPKMRQYHLFCHCSPCCGAQRSSSCVYDGDPHTCRGHEGSARSPAEPPTPGVTRQQSVLRDSGRLTGRCGQRIRTSFPGRHAWGSEPSAASSQRGMNCMIGVER
jgi:hypothetical protein